jgi:hypothetical protein
MLMPVPSPISVKPRLGALTGLALLTTVLAWNQALSAPLAGASRQLEPDHAPGDLIQVGGSRYRGHRTIERYGHHHFRLRHTGNQDRYSLSENGYEGVEYLPRSPYYSHRYNWYPPIATFRYADPLWYVW